MTCGQSHKAPGPTLASQNIRREEAHVENNE